jgi:hypothetical protein
LSGQCAQNTINNGFQNRYDFLYMYSWCGMAGLDIYGQQSGLVTTFCLGVVVGLTSTDGSDNYACFFVFVFTGSRHKILFPVALALGVAPATLVACFPATATLFILPNYPTLLAAVALDDTGSTRLGTRIIDHPLLPGLIATILSILFAAGLSWLII